MEKRFIVTDHNYLNTGGNTMVSIFAVYDSQENVSRWVIANEEGFSWQTADTISNCDFQMDCDEIMDKVLLGNWDWSALTTEPCWDQHLFEDDEWELFKYCQFEFYKKDCKYFNNKVRLAVNELPNDLFGKLTEDYITWSIESGNGCLTDGYEVFMDDNYEPPVELESPILTDMKSFLGWLNDYVKYARLEDCPYITIAVAGDSVKIPFHADTFDLLTTFIEKAIKDY